MMKELLIIGGGPAGVAAGVYASRKQLTTTLITPTWGGQSVDSTNIQNWIGTPEISGADLAKNLEQHLQTYAADIVERVDDTVVNITKETDFVRVTTAGGATYEAKALLIASGSTRRKLAVPGADTFEHKGLTYCASCDGPLFSGQDVVVVGGGNAGFESAAQLLAYAKSVTLLTHSDTFKADPVTVEKVLAHPNMTAITNADTTEIHGEQFVNGLTYKDTVSDETITLDVTGVFVEIGMIPNTSFLEGVVPLDEYHRVKIDPWTQKTEVPGIWAAGDCTNILYHQNNISAGHAVTALEDIYVTLRAS